MPLFWSRFWPFLVVIRILQAIIGRQTESTDARRH